MMKRTLAGALICLFAFGGVAQAASPSRYVVKQGDTLGQIAQRNQVTVGQLAQANPQITNISLIYPGQQITLPAEVGEQEAAGSNARYTVKAGDTIGQIAWRNGLMAAELLRVNPQITNTSLIYPGQQLTLPAAGWEQTADSIIDMGLSYWGTPYVYGAQRFQDKSFDCSSFVQYIYDKHGISLGWTAREQALQGEWIPFDQMRKGDLMFFWDDNFPNEEGISKVRHVGIYMGDGKILHTYEEGIGVTVSTIRDDSHMGNYWYTHFMFAKRVIN